MRTKTVLLTAALAVAGAVTTMAQVYSVNAVGYVNVTVNNGFNLIANPLDNKTSNKVKDIIGTSLTDGAQIYKFANGVYGDVNDFNEAKGTWSLPDQELKPGEGAFVYLDSGGPISIVFVGDVPQGELTTPLLAGFNMVSSQVPQEGTITAQLKFAAGDGDQVYKFENTGTTAGYTADSPYSYNGAKSTWQPSEPVIKVGEAIWLYSDAGGSWSRTFDVNNPN